MDSSHLHHISVSVDSGGGGGGGVGGDRFPQWSVQETRDFLLIRAELDPTFMETKRNKLLWEVISTKMKERGYNRSGEQCKCKWKNLVTRYKGIDTMEQEGMKQQFPFYNELQAIFTGRMQRMLWMEAEGGVASGSSKKRVMHLSSEDEDDNDESDVEKAGGSKKKKKKMTNDSKRNTDSIMVDLREILEDMMKQQMQIEMEWMKRYEAKEEERRVREMEWRQTMEALENEKIMFDRRWREREEQRRIREENRSEKRDALITALLDKLRREGL